MNSPLVAAWRLLIAGCAGAGVVLAAGEYDIWWTALSQLANLSVAVAFLGLAVREPSSPWLRGSLVTLMVLVALAYLPMQNGNLAEAWSVLEHVVTPALVLIDFIVVGRNQHRVRWWHPLTWMVPPTVYLTWYVSADLGVYSALDLGHPLAFAARTGVLAALVLGTGYALYNAGRRRRLAVADG